MGEAELLPEGHYAPSIEYTAQCREINERYLAQLDAEPSEVKALRRSGRQWARGQLAAAVRPPPGRNRSFGGRWRCFGERRQSTGEPCLGGAPS